MRDPFHILGVAADAPPARVRAAFRERAFRCHPDRNPGDPRAEERFKRLVAAYRSAMHGSPEPASCDRAADAPPPPPIRERYVCPRCDDTFPVPEPCFRCGDEVFDSLEQIPTPAPADPRVQALIAELERARPAPVLSPGPDFPFAAAVVFAVVGASAVHVGLAPLGVMLFCFGALLVGREIHARREIHRTQLG